MACQRCRHLKKGCKQDGRERCQRCVLSDQVCVYVDVASDPTAPRPPGSSQPVVVPDSPINSPSEPPSSSTFDLYNPISSSSEEQYAPHLLRMRNDHRSSLPNPNPQAPGLSIYSSSSHTDGPSPSLLPPDSFADQPLFDTTYPHIHGNGIYDPSAAQDLFAQVPDSFIPCGKQRDQDIIDPPHSPHHLRSRSNPSPLSHSNVQALTSAYGMASNPQGPYGGSSYLTPLLPTEFPITSNTSDLFGSYSASTPDHSPVSFFEDSHVSSYGLP
jgi:hypothetical protein